MKSNTPRILLLLAALVLALSSSARAQIQSVSNSDVEGYFGATSDAWQQAEGPTTGSWGVSGPGFYPVTGPPAAPQLYPGFPAPTVTIPSNINFIPNHVLGTPFTDGTTTASYNIYGGINGAGTFTEDAYVQLGAPGAVGMYLNQPPTAIGYAYEQVEFAAVFTVGTGGLTGSAPGPRPINVFGNVVPAGYAQFGAEVNYWFFPGIPGTTIIGSPQFLGNLQYNFQVSNSSGPFAATVNFAPTTLAGATGTGFLVVVGNAFVAGDPFDITVQSVPEPSSYALLLVGMAGLGLYRARRRKA